MKRPEEIEKPLTDEERRKIAAVIAHAEDHFSKGDDRLHIVMEDDDRLAVRDAVADEIADAGWVVEVKGKVINVDKP